MTIHELKIKFSEREIKLAMNIDAGNPIDDFFLYSMRVGGCPEPEVCHLMARVAKPGNYVIDGGANVGFFTVLLSKLVGPEGLVLAFEPGANNLFKLDENIKLNGCANIEVVRKPLWSEPAIVGLHLCADGSKNSLEPHAGSCGVQSMEAAVLHDYSPDQMDRQLSLIKLDIEGAEEMALRGGKDLLGKCPYIVMELNIEALPKFKSSPAQICDFLRDYGYSPFLLHPNGGLPTYIPRRTKVVPKRLNWNVLFSSLDMVGAAWPEIMA